MLTQVYDLVDFTEQNIIICQLSIDIIAARYTRDACLWHLPEMVIS
jgi:hypothetical protein